MRCRTTNQTRICVLIAHVGPPTLICCSIRLPEKDFQTRRSGQRTSMCLSLLSRGRLPLSAALRQQRQEGRTDLQLSNATSCAAAPAPYNTLQASAWWLLRSGDGVGRRQPLLTARSITARGGQRRACPGSQTGTQAWQRRGCEE